MVAEIHPLIGRLSSPATFGIMLPTEFPLKVATGEEVIAAARLADDRGIDAIWVGDHIMFHSPILDSLSILAMLAGVTLRAVLGSGVLIAPLRHPVLLAKAAGTIDHLSGGRFVLGLGVGGESPAEFAAVGAHVSDRGKRTDAMIPLLRDLLVGRSVSAPASLGGFIDVQLDPPSPHPSGPPIIVGGRSDAALARAARLSEGWIGYFASPSRFERSWHTIENQAEAADRDPAALLPAALVFCAVDDNEDRARRLGDDWLSAQFGLPPEKLRHYCLTGTAEMVAEKAALWIRAGVRHLVLGCAGSVPTDQVAAIAEGVVPALRRSIA